MRSTRSKPRGKKPGQGSTLEEENPDPILKRKTDTEKSVNCSDLDQEIRLNPDTDPLVSTIRRTKAGFQLSQKPDPDTEIYLYV